MSPRWLLVGAVAASLALSGCEKPAESAITLPARVVPIEGSDLHQVILTEEAAQRIDVQTAPVLESSPDRVTVPVSAVVYDANGVTWVYTQVAPLTFVRQRVSIVHVTGGIALLQSGPSPGVQIVVVGAAELLGVEYGVEGE